MSAERRLAAAAGILAAFLLLNASVYTLSEWEQAIITQFGRPVGSPVTEAGLHFKLPFIQLVRRLDKRILNWDGYPNQIPTTDKKYIWGDTTARWRITDP
ncbi:MAG: SPFH domain-containing protein, partial [Elusimicrobiota bacterium]